MVVVAPVAETEAIEAVRELLLEYEASLRSDFGYHDAGAPHDSLPGEYSSPSGALFLATVADAPAGCVALRRLRESICEMKHLYVRPSYRAHGLGAALVGAAIQHARELAYRELWLDTLPSMHGAHHLYNKLGFREIPAYGQAAPGSHFYGLRLVA
jgi:putative acetyltransferase